MNMQDVNPNRKYVDFLDVVELIKRIRNDEKGIKTEENSIRKYTFNPLLEEYEALKRAYLENPTEENKKIFNERLNSLVKKQDGYEDAIAYVDNRINSQEEEEL